MKKKLMSLFLCLCMLITMLPTAAYASQGDRLSTTARTTEEKTENPFTDVKKSDWFYNAVQYARGKGFFAGTSTTTFTPNGTMTRSMFVAVLGRMAGVDTEKYKGESSFSDVKVDAYYAPYVAWAAKHGITSGVGNGKFAPDELINRQQMAAFFVRYFETFGVDYDTGVNITTIPADIDSVADYAKDAVLKLWRNGLLAGDGVNFDPLGSASRAQAAALCMRTDEVVKTWYKEPGVPKEETPVVAPPSGGGSSGGNTTVYYNVTLIAGEETTTKTYPSGTLLSSIPVPYQAGKLFLGWYYDNAFSSIVADTDTLTSNLTLHAKLIEAIPLTEGGEINFATKQDVETNFTITINAGSKPVVGTDFKFRNITNPSVTDGTDGVVQETVSVTGSAGSFTVASANGGFTPGHTYQIELLNDGMTFAGEGEEVRYFNFIVHKDEVLNLELNNDVNFISASDLSESDRSKVLEYDGLNQAVINSRGVTTFKTNDSTGSFTYSGGGISVGDTVAIYNGKKPDERTVADSGDVAYVKIIKIDGTTYYYQSAEAEDVIFTPDVLPIDLDPGDGVSSNASGTLVVDSDRLSFDSSNIHHSEMGLGADTVVEPGDFLAFFNKGDLGDVTANKQGYGKIVSVSVNGGTTTIVYESVSEETVLKAMELYSESELSESDIIAAYDEQLISQAVESQLKASGFIQEAGEYLATLAVQTDEIKEIFNSGDNLTLTDYTITYSDGTPVSKDELTLMGNIVDKDGGVKISVSASPKLVHFKGKPGIRVEVAVTYKFDIQKSGSNKKVAVELTAFFEQEVVFGFSVSGGAVWKWKFIIPYIADYRMTGHIDLGTYTGVGITATAKLGQDEETWGMDWPPKSDAASAEKDIIDLSEAIKKKMNAVETLFPKSEGSSSGGLAEKYAEFMKDANEKWIDLFVVELLNLSGAVDPLHLLAYGIDVDFVVSANLNVAIGMTFQYENSKRHSFALSLKSKKGDSETIDLSTNGYQFDFYVMGTLGIRAGIRAKAMVGLFSTKLAGIGLQIEAGAYARLWGYFYYSLTNYKIGGVWVKTSNYSGAMLVEIGAYLDVKFIAEALNGKYSYAPNIHAKEWPFWWAGERENVYDFAYEKAPTYNIQNVTTYTLPTIVYDMKWMDLKTGDKGENDKPKTKNFDENTVHNTKDEKYFVVELSNPAFTYDPVNNKIRVNTDSGAVEQSCEMKITWKGASLAGSSEVLSRTISLNWSNDKDAATIAFDTGAGSAVQMLCLLAGTVLEDKMPKEPPTRLGYDFAGWYTDAAYGTPFTATTMPSGNTTLYAKWTPKTVSYTVEHYQKALDGQYVLIATDNTPTGEVDGSTDAKANNYTGFTAKAIEQQKIAFDGSTIVEIYYDRNLYDLKFVYGNGSNDITLRALFGSPIVKPSNPSKPGYTFNGWSAEIPSTMPAGALTFTAKWAPKTDTPYIVKYYKQNLNGTTYVLDQTEGKSGTTGQSTNFNNTNTYIGFTALPFDQKIIAADGRTVIEIKYNRNIYPLSWNVNDGEPLTEGSYTKGDIKYGTPIVTPQMPTREGYIFAGWYKDAGLTVALEDNATMPDTALTLTAKWDAATVRYKVKHIQQDFDGNYPESGSLVEVEEKEGITEQNTTAAAKPYEGFTVQDFTQMPIAANGTTVVVIKYARNSYIVEFDGNGNDNGDDLMEDMAFQYGETKNLTANVYTLTGHTFVCWNTKADGSGTSYTDAQSVQNLSSEVDGTVTLYAQWTINTYDVSFDTNKEIGSSEPMIDVEKIKVTHGSTYGRLPTVSRTGYTFDGWYTEKVGGTVVSDTNIVTTHHTLYAHWTAYTYTVEFDPNSGSGGPMENQDFTYDVAQNLTEIGFTKTGYTFTGWNTMADGKGTSYTNKESVINFTDTNNETITLYAQWEINTYTIIFNTNDGSGSSEKINVTHGSTYGTLPPVSRIGYAFEGWFTELVGGTKVSDTGIVETSHTLYAIWTPNTYTVNFHGRDGAEGSMSSQVFAYDIQQPLSACEFTKTGYYLSGWATEENGIKVYEPGENVKNLRSEQGGSVDLYTIWEPMVYTVLFDGNKGSGSTDVSVYYNKISVTYGTAYGTLPTASRQNYTFEGWYTSATEGTQITGAEIYTIADNQTLYAHWSPVKVTIKFWYSSTDVEPFATTETTRDGNYVLPEAVPTKENYDFIGWYTTSDPRYGWKITESNTLRNNDYTTDLYAAWESSTKNINFFRDGVSTTEAKDSYYMHSWPEANKGYGQGWAFKDTATPEGKAFVGWYLDDAFTQPLVGDTKVELYNGMNLYARYLNLSTLAGYEDYAEITSADDLQALALNYSYHTVQTKYLFTSDIELENWTYPIGYMEGNWHEAPFYYNPYNYTWSEIKQCPNFGGDYYYNLNLKAGTIFDGGGHTITITETMTAPFFGSNRTGSFKNLTIDATAVSEVRINGGTGLLGATASEIDNCHVSCTNLSIGYDYRNFYGGGLVAYISNGTIKNSSFTGSITSKSIRTGGIVGSVSAPGTIENCIATVDIKNSPYDTFNWYIGGIVGYVYGESSEKTCTITGCEVYSNVEYQESHEGAAFYISNVASSARLYVGGIMGYGNSYNSVSNCTVGTELNKLVISGSSPSYYSDVFINVGAVCGLGYNCTDNSWYVDVYNNSEKKTVKETSN